MFDYQSLIYPVWPWYSNLNSKPRSPDSKGTRQTSTDFGGKRSKGRSCPEFGSWHPTCCAARWRRRWFAARWGFIVIQWDINGIYPLGQIAHLLTCIQFAFYWNIDLKIWHDIWHAGCLSAGPRDDHIGSFSLKTSKTKYHLVMTNSSPWKITIFNR